MVRDRPEIIITPIGPRMAERIRGARRMFREAMKTVLYLLGVLIGGGDLSSGPGGFASAFFRATTRPAAPAHEARARRRRGRHRPDGARLVLRPQDLSRHKNGAIQATSDFDRRQNSIASSNCSRVNGFDRQQVAPRSMALRKKSESSMTPLPPA